MKNRKTFEEDYDGPIGHINRIESLSNKKGTFWCLGCDAQLVHPGEKCPNCGKKQESRKLKGY